MYKYNSGMNVVSYSNARNNLKTLIDTTIDEAEVAIIHRRDGEDAVLMGRSMYESMLETLHLLSTPANTKHLLASIAEDKAGKAKVRRLQSS
jgi:antitoxin YefM